MNQDSNPKIYVMQLKELIYTAVFIILAIVLIIVMVSMFAPDNEKNDATMSNATVPVYSYEYEYQ